MLSPHDHDIDFRDAAAVVRVAHYFIVCVPENGFTREQLTENPRTVRVNERFDEEAELVGDFGVATVPIPSLLFTSRLGFRLLALPFLSVLFALGFGLLPPPL
jgi:hypothetical protein